MELWRRSPGDELEQPESEIHWKSALNRRAEPHAGLNVLNVEVLLPSPTRLGRASLQCPRSSNGLIRY
jgi:hypothetical protein